MTTTPGWRLRVLGPIGLEVGGVHRAVPGGRPLAVLAVLALDANRTVSVEAMTDRVWGEDLPVEARGVVQTYIARLRPAVGADRIRTEAGGYRLRAATNELDLLHFRHLVSQAAEQQDPQTARARYAEALALWEGEPLTGVRSDVLQSEDVPRLAEERLAAVEARVDLELWTGRGAESVGELQTLTARHPLRESLWARLMRVLHVGNRTGEALACYHRAAEWLDAELGVRPGRELQRLHDAILSGDHAENARVGAPPRPPSVPRQLPGDPAHLVGREHLMTELDTAYAERRLVNLDGMGGIGKTSLVVRWAHRRIEEFPDGQLFASLGGYSADEPATPTAVLGEFLESLGAAPEQIPSGVQARSAAFRTMVAGRRLLVMLDDARDAEQVRPLLPGSGFTVVTSRNQQRGLIVRDGARRITVPRLAHADCVRLFTDVIGGERADVERDSVADVVASCDRHPLALRVLAERASRTPGLALGQLAAEVRAEETRLDALSSDDPRSDPRAVLATSYHALDPEASRAFRLLASHPGGRISLGAAAALIDREPRETRRSLDRLVAGHLLTEPHPGWYQFHDLLAAFAREVAGQETSDAAYRLAVWYVETGYAANERMGGSGSLLPPEPRAEGTPRVRFDFTYRSALDWLREEWTGLCATARACVRAGWHRETCELVFNLFELYRSPAHQPELLTLGELALESARTLGPVWEANALNLAGAACAGLGRHHEAIDRFTEVLELRQRLGDEYGVLSVHHNLGAQYNEVGDFARALTCYQRILDHAGDDTAPLAPSAIRSMADVYLDSGRYAEAMPYAERALTAARATGDEVTEALALEGRAVCHAQRGDHVSAVADLRLAVDLQRQLTIHRYLAAHLRLLGDSLRALGQAESAREAWLEALRLYDGLGMPEADVLRQSLAELAGLGHSPTSR